MFIYFYKKVTIFKYGYTSIENNFLERTLIWEAYVFNSSSL